jgi:hypothetical protein
VLESKYPNRLDSEIVPFLLWPLVGRGFLVMGHGSPLPRTPSSPSAVAFGPDNENGAKKGGVVTVIGTSICAAVHDS